ncbi:MAG: hypothetical protein ACRD0D_00840 [Acidimicrobiales bacterium]
MSSGEAGPPAGAAGEIEPATGDINDLPLPLVLPPGSDLPSQGYSRDFGATSVMPVTYSTPRPS